MSEKPKRPRDPNQLAKLIVDVATREAVYVDELSDTEVAAIAAAEVPPERS
jgi:hypothetical protein